MSLKDNISIKNLSKDEKKKKSIQTYVITAICCFLLIVLNINFFVCVFASIVCGFCYFLFGPKPVLKQKKKEKIKKRSSLDEEYLREFDEENK